MPYQKTADLPQAFSKMPEEAKRMAMQVLNDRLEQGDDEETAIKKAMGAVKRSYKQDKDGKWVAAQDEAEAKLETVDLPDVEILAAGTWHGNKTITIEKKDLPQFVASFNELTANHELNYEAPAKLGHDEKQKLLQGDGYPAAGWVSALKVKGDKLIASFRQVPKKLAELIKAGAYKKVSAEFYQDYEIGGKKYPWVLKAVAFLGADTPAVKTIGDIAAQYSEALLDEAGVPFFAVTLGEVTLDEVLGELDAWAAKAEGAIKGKAGSPAIRTYLREVKAKLRHLLEKEGKLAEGDSLTRRVRAIQDAYVQQTRNPLAPGEMGGWVCEVFDGSVIVEKAGKFYQVPFSEEGESVSFQLDQAVEVRQQISYVKAAEAPAAAAFNPQANNETEVSVEKEKEIREALGLDEKGDVLAAVTALKAKANQPQAATLAEQTKLQAEVDGLKQTIALKERDERVSRAISSGKVTPAQKPWADAYALSDPAGFDKFMETAPQVVKLGETGSSADAPAVTLTAKEEEVAAAMGVSKEAVLAAKKQEVK